MATKFVTNLDLNSNQILNGTFEVLTADPSSGNFEGRMYYNSQSDVVKYYTGSAWKLLVNGVVAGGDYAAAITVNESGGQITITPNLATTSAAGVMSATDKTKLDNATADATGSTLVIRDVNGQAKFGTPTDDAHAATKGYVDAARAGLDVKQSVRVATTGPVNLASDLEAGDLIDSITLGEGDRVLVKNQSTASENGIYVVQATGAAVRAVDFDGVGEVSGGAFTFVELGTTNADSGWVVTSDGPLTVGTDAINWAQFSGAGQITAGDGLTKTGNTINVVGTTDRISVSADAVDIAATYAGQNTITTVGTIGTGTWEATDVGVAHGGTGASTESGARTNLASASSEASGRTTSAPALARVAKQGCAASVAGTSTTTVTHNFDTLDVLVQVYEVSTGMTVIADVTRANSNTVSVVILGSVSANDFTIVVTG